MEAAMDIGDALDDLTDDGRAVAHRARVATMLNQIAQQTKQALSGLRPMRALRIDADINLDIFFLLPNSGEVIVTLGTPGNHPDDEWNRVGGIVGSIVAQSIGLDRVRCRPVTCATTDSIADHQPTKSPAQPSEPSGCRPAPAPALQQAGAESR
jgi:hypothetical protein